MSEALLISWFNGSEGGNALADVLLGKLSPGGRLPFTIPVKLKDSPAYALGNYPQQARNEDIFGDLVAKEKTEKENSNQKTEKEKKADPNNAYYSEGLLVGYRWFDTKDIPVMYPFGYGLSYTSFDYSNLKTNKGKYGRKGVIKLTFDLKNTGKMSADEVPQAYVHRLNSSVKWPEKELKAFARVPLKPGESKKVSLTIPVKELMYWNEETHGWDYDPCDLEVQVGSSSGDIKLKKKITLR